MKEFGRWLGEATRSLEVTSQKRVQAELSQHYLDAAEHYREAGLSESGAEHAALRDLGDPHRLNRALRRTHLTQREADRLAAYEAWWGARRWVWQLIGLEALAGVLAVAAGHPEFLVTLLSLAAVLVAARAWLLRRWTPRRAALALTALARAASFVGVPLLCWQDNPGVVLLNGAAAAVLFFVVWAACQWRIWRRL